MSNQSIWQMVQECARELTKAGSVPFTRQDIIACIKRRSPRCDENSINPIIQGVTDNLKGGTPGADGKKVLHSVGRGLFVLYSKKDSFDSVVAVPTSLQRDGAAKPQTGGTAPETENGLRDHLISLLHPRLVKRRDIQMLPEGLLSYVLPDGVTLRTS